MSIKGFRGKLKSGELHYQEFPLVDFDGAPFEYHTGTFDRNNTPIYEGDTLRQMSCEQTFKVDDIVSFLLMCGRYEERHGAPIFDSLEVVNESKNSEQ